MARGWQPASGRDVDVWDGRSPSGHCCQGPWVQSPAPPLVTVAILGESFVSLRVPAPASKKLERKRINQRR
jgi:hypothetical protein